MTDFRRDVDVLLANAASRMIHASETTMQMRCMQKNGADEHYWRKAQQLADDLRIAGHCLTQAHTILLQEDGLSAIAEGFQRSLGGGMIQ